MVSTEEAPQRNQFLSAASILLMVVAAMVLIVDVISWVSSSWLAASLILVFDAYIVFTGIVGFRNAANRNKAGLVIALGVGLIGVPALIVIIMTIVSYM